MNRVYSGRQRCLVGLLMCGFTVAPSFAQAPRQNAPALGITESILHYCGSVDAAAAAKLQQKIEALLQGLSEEQVAEIRDSEEYHQAYDSIREMVNAAPAGGRLQACTGEAKR